MHETKTNQNFSAILYSYRRCPYAMRARMAIKLAKIPVEIIDISLKNKPPRLLEISPKGTVPVLEIKINGTSPQHIVIDESLDIILLCCGTLKKHQNLNKILFNEHSAAASAAPTLLLQNNNKNQDMLNLINDSDKNFKPKLDRYKYPERFLEKDNSENKSNYTAETLSTNNQASALEWIKQNIEQKLENNIYLFDTEFKLADIATLPFIRQFMLVNETWFREQDIPKTIKWLDNLITSSLFKSIM